VVANFSSNNVQSFKVNSATGGITASVTGPYPTATGARYVAFHPNGNFVYIANNGSNSVSIFSIVPSSGNLATVDLTFVVAATPIRPVFDPTGEFMYVGSNSTNQLFGYRVDSSTGTLSALEGSPYDTLTSPAFAVLVQVPR
jgi:6-phosphogluconolactonase (cycloisomerase 2 family)